MAQKIGIIGLGIMGTAYATNLRKAGYDVFGSDPSEQARHRLNQLGGTAFETTGDWSKNCDLIILSLVSPVVMKDVANILATILNPGQIVIETGTFTLDDKMAAMQALQTSGISLLDCPVSGTGSQALKGDLLMMMSGDPDAIAKARPIVEHFTKGVIEAGPFGTGTKLKFVANHAVAVHNTAAAETLAYADAIGLDRDQVFKMLSTGAGQSRMSDLRMPLMISGQYEPPLATLKMFEKDLTIIGNDITRLNLDTPLFDASAKLYAKASQTLPETYDTASVFEVYQQDKS